ncbi:MAG: hypothetical protein QNJ98_19495 [Planctomycetota bacterium]|nr:hypothetical protein [Planctomycetota bacterium]
MRIMGWVMIVFGLVGVVTCAYGIVLTNRTADRAEAATASLAKEARGLLDRVDRQLVDVPGRVTRLVQRKDEGTIGRELGRLEEALAASHETGSTILSLLRVAARLRGDATVNEEFPNAVALHGALGTAHGLVRDQRADMRTWTLRAAAVNRAIETARREIAEAREATQRVETGTIDTLALVALLGSLFLVWMGVGQLALALLGRGKASAPA